MRANIQALRQQDVVSFDHAGFEDACADLMRQVLHDFRPDAIVAVPSGGLHVAEAMARTMGNRVPVLSLTCRRATTSYKNGVGALKALASNLPRSIVDRLRVWEHAMLTRKTRPVADTPYNFDPTELSRLERWMAGAGGQPSLLVVDDAIDTGATLSHVIDALNRRAPALARIRSAVITVTTRQPLISPHYALYQQQLCRFPWSLDA